MPLLARARALVWIVLALVAAAGALAPATPPPAAVVRDAGRCRLAGADRGPACACQELPARMRLVLGLPLPLDRASSADLALLPGIGSVRAAAIVAERERGGPFASVAELARRVRGIGPVMLERVRAHLFAGSRDPACTRGVEALRTG